MKFEIAIIERWKTENGSWDFDELALNVFSNWEDAKREIEVMISKGYLVEVKIIQSNKISDPKIAREVDPSKYKMTKEMYEYGKSFFDSQKEYKCEFYDIYEISWERAYNEWDSLYVTGKWDPRDWAGYMLDRLEDADESFQKFPILELK